MMATRSKAMAAATCVKQPFVVMVSFARICSQAKTATKAVMMATSRISMVAMLHAVDAVMACARFMSFAMTATMWTEMAATPAHYTPAATGKSIKVRLAMMVTYKAPHALTAPYSHA